MNFFKKFPLLFILFVFLLPVYAFDIDEMLDGDGLSNGFTHFLRIGIKTDVSSFQLEGDARISAKKERALGEIQGGVTVSAASGGISVDGRVFK